MMADPGDPRPAEISRVQAANTWLADYASFLAHDLRNPLTAANGFLSLLADGAVSGPDAAEYITQARAAVRDAQAQLDGLAQLARELAGGASAAGSHFADTTMAVQRVWAHVQAHTRTRAALRLGVLPPVGVSRVALERMLYHLLSHAVRATEPVDAPRIVVIARTDQARVTLEVRDNGAPLAARAWSGASVFSYGTELESAEELDADARGFGRLVQCQGGRVRAQREPRGGASVMLELPAAAGRSPSASGTP